MSSNFLDSHCCSPVRPRLPQSRPMWPFLFFLSPGQLPPPVPHIWLQPCWADRGAFVWAEMWVRESRPCSQFSGCLPTHFPQPLWPCGHFRGLQRSLDGQQRKWGDDSGCEGFQGGGDRSPGEISGKAVIQEWDMCLCPCAAMISSEEGERSGSPGPARWLLLC